MAEPLQFRIRFAALSALECPPAEATVRNASEEELSAVPTESCRTEITKYAVITAAVESPHPKRPRSVGKRTDEPFGMPAAAMEKSAEHIAAVPAFPNRPCLFR